MFLKFILDPRILPKHGSLEGVNTRDAVKYEETRSPLKVVQEGIEADEVPT